MPPLQPTICSRQWGLGGRACTTRFKISERSIWRRWRDIINGAASPIAGVQALLLGLISNNDDVRALGCMGVGAICEFGSTDPEIAALRAKVSPALRSRLTERLKEGQAAGEIDCSLDCAAAASFIQMTMQGMQLAARGGIDATSLRAQARFIVERLTSR